MAHKDSDYTVVIAIMHCPNRTILVLKLTLVVHGDMSTFVSPWTPLLERSLRLPVAVPFLGKAHEDSDYTVVIDRCHSLTLTCQNSLCWRSCERCISFLSSPWAAIADSVQSIDLDSRRCTCIRPVDRAWPSRGMCINWNALQYLACATVATRLPGVRLPLVQ